MKDDQGHLFGEPPEVGYPNEPGWKEPTTSREAAETVDAGTLRADVVETLGEFGPMTADECATALGCSVLSIRPRFSELRAKNVIRDTGQRRENISGRRAIVWELVERGE